MTSCSSSILPTPSVQNLIANNHCEASGNCYYLSGERGLASEPRQRIDDPAHDWGVVLAQDFANLARVQQGMRQRGFPKTRLAGYQERRLANRHNVIDTYYERFGGKEAAK